MRKVYIKRIIACVMMLCCLSVTTVYATITQEDIDNAKNQVDNLQQQVDDAEKELDAHNDKKDKLEGNLKDLNTNLQTLVNELADLSEQISNKQDEITVTTQELEDAEERSAKQYEDMKLRIQYMYENANVSMLTMFLEADSMSDFLNQAEYVSSINTYDRAKLEEYQQLQADIAEKKATLEEEERELLALKDSVESKRTEVNSLIATTEKNISQTKTDIANAEAEVEDLEEKLVSCLISLAPNKIFIPCNMRNCLSCIQKIENLFEDKICII